jgi:hypothetical protein
VTVELKSGTSLVDLLWICHKLPTDEREQWEVLTGMEYEPDRMASEFFNRPHPKWTVFAGDEPIMAAGFSELRPGVWQDWALTTPAAWDTHWRGVTKAAKRVMDFMLREHAHRLQCVSLASRIHAHRWYRPLGLELEGTLRSYGVNGEDALMFSRLRSP